MIAVLGIEAIGDDDRHRQAQRRLRSMPLRLGEIPASKMRSQITEMMRYEQRPRAWIARITGTDARYGIAREFLRFKRDYAEANGTGSRGVHQWYELAEGEVFEVNAPISWTSADRYFCRSERGKVIRMTREEVDAWISPK